MHQRRVLDIALIGAQKSGTTSLAALLAQHPSVCVAQNKETHLFDQHRVQQKGLHPDDLLGHFPHREHDQVLVDATPSYLYLPGCVESLVRHNPNIRILVILRDPAERAVSHHAHEQRLGYERRLFLSALILERFRLRRDHDPLAPHSAHRHFSYIDRGRYSKQLQRLSSITPNYLVLNFSDLLTSPQETMDRVFTFLRLPSIEVRDIPHLNRRHDQPKQWQIRLARLLLRNKSQHFVPHKAAQLESVA